MITICRAEDGQVFQVNASVRDIEVIGSLELFLHQETGVDQDAALAYLSDGRRLTTGNIRDLGSSQDQFVFVFNKHYLDYGIEDVLRQLHVEPPLQPAIEDVNATTPPIRHAQIAASYAHASHMHHEHVQHLLRSIQFQHQAIRIASTTLDLNVLAISETFDGIAAGARKELEKQASLLTGLDADLELISRVGVHVEFCSTAVRMAIEAGDPQRVLADYVSKQKMKQVADTCTRTHEDLQFRFNQVEQAVNSLKDGADHVRAMVSNRSLLDEAEACCQRSHEILDRISDAAAKLERPVSDSDSVIQELKQLDNVHRQELEQITNRKNIYTHQCLTVLHRISALNNDIMYIPPALSALQTSLRGKTSFSHIQRLHNMLYAYCATVIEIVRRKEFSRFFYQRAQSILEVMAKVSASERKRRHVYRGEVHGLLPFETRGMDDPVPTIDFSPAGGSDSAYSLERSDVDGLLHVLEDLEKYSSSTNDPAALKATRECRTALEKLITKMDNLEAGFDKIAERSILSASRVMQSRRRSTDAEDKAIQELADELRMTHEAKLLQESSFQDERATLQAEIHRLKTAQAEADASLIDARDRSSRLERELHQVRSQMESEGVARRILEERNSELSADISKQRNQIAHALADATEQSRVAEALRQEIAQVQTEFEEVKALEIRNADKVVHLLQEQSNSLRHLEEARSRGEDLELQIQAARSESDEVHQALKEASLEKDRLLKAQASEHDRVIRDHIAEADGDRAVLDRQFSELQAVLEDKDRQLKNLRGDLEVANADAVGLKEEYQRIDHELREARHMERLLRDDLRAGRASQSDFEQRTEGSNRLIAQILDVAISFRNSHVKALHASQAMASHPNPLRQTSNLADSTFSASNFRHSIIGQPDEPSPIDPSDPAAALDILRDFDHDHFLEAVSKTGFTIRKWQKQCKEYRERAKGKISFRNFAKGDLALFLPTRNSVSKPWAAFNVSFPHYFLQATGHLAEQLKSREWIVARITSIAERVVDHKDPTSNPYGLGDGVKYYMLEVEDWTQPSHNKRRISSRKVSNENESQEEFQPGAGKLSPSSLPPGPPEAEVEDTFLVTHPPNSHLFPVRARSNSSPTARPSSLSRLLAQASPAPELVLETQPGPVPEIRSPSPPTFPPPPSPTNNTGSIPHSHHNAPSISSPLRPDSRTSRKSTTSRFSVGRIPALASVAASQSKAAATTALTDQPVASSPSSSDNPFGSPITPSPEGSISDGMSNVITSRRRTTSYHMPRTSPLASSSSQSTVVPSRPTLTASGTLANLVANSWGMSFGRKKKSELASLAPTVESLVDDLNGSTDYHSADNQSAQDLLKRL
ncbi:putative peripheral membrane protein [Crassisporium funariophilum]|nr:putative peripheral membrane protein [Crassisporium funariophilum]